MSLTHLSNSMLRRAIRIQAVSFPGQMPVFPKQSRSDIQWRMAHLYFVQGWSEKELAERFRISRRRACQILDGWRGRAIAQGYVQEIAPEQLAEIATPIIADDGPSLVWDSGQAPLWTREQVDHRVRMAAEW
jgi:hypothetical protein